MSEKGVELRSTDSPFGSAQGRVGAASPTWDFRSIDTNALRGWWRRSLVGVPSASSGQALRLRICFRFAKADAPLRMTTLVRLSVYRSYIIWQYEYEGAGSCCFRAGEDSAAEDFYRGVVGE